MTTNDNTAVLEDLVTELGMHELIRQLTLVTLTRARSYVVHEPNTIDSDLYEYWTDVARQLDGLDL